MFKQGNAYNINLLPVAGGFCCIKALSKKSAHVIAFEGKEPAFDVGACGVACEGAVGSYHTVAGNDYGDGVVTYCAAYCLGGHGGNSVFGGYCFGKSAVSGGLTVGDLTEVTPDLLTEGSAGRGEGEIGDGGIFTGEVKVEPVDRRG